MCSKVKGGRSNSLDSLVTIGGAYCFGARNLDSEGREMVGTFGNDSLGGFEEIGWGGGGGIGWGRGGGGGTD